MEKVKVDVEEVMREIRADIQRRMIESIDIEQIMCEIREQAKELAAEDMPDFTQASDAPVSVPAAPAYISPEGGVVLTIPGDGGIGAQISNEAVYLKGNSYVPYYREVGKGPKSFVKRAIRRANRFYLLPANEQQNQFNLHAANGIDALRIGLDYHQDQFNILFAAAQELKDRVNDFDRSDEIERFGRQLKRLSGELDDIRAELAAHGAAIGDSRRGDAVFVEQFNAFRHNQDLLSMKVDAQQRSFETQKEELAAQKEELAAQKKALAGQRDVFAAQKEAIEAQAEQIRTGIEVHASYLSGQQAQLNILQTRVDDAQRITQGNEVRLKEMDRAIDEMSLSIARTIKHYLAEGEPLQASRIEGAAADAPKAPTTIPAEGGSDYEMLDYFKFENDFRGTQTEIMERQKVYLPYFRGKKGKIFDFGCGRGEFLRLLKEEGIPGYGVDRVDEYAITGGLYGIDVSVGDAFAALEQASEPLGGVFCAQVIEHIGFRNIQRLCKLAYDKLEDGGCIVLESVNPMCISVFANSFYVDPTHDKPVHPLMVQYLLKSIGFKDVQLVLPDHTLEPLPKIQGEGIDNLDEVNRAIERVSHLLFGSQDYAVVARK